MDDATLFKFGKWINYGKSHRRDKKFPLKGAWSGLRDYFENFKPFSVFLKWMKLHSLNLANGSTTASPTRRLKKSPKRGVFWVT